MARLLRESANGLAKLSSELWLWKGRHVKLLDGSTLSAPDTAENQKQYPQHGLQKKGVGFPIIRCVGVVSLSCGAIFDLAFGRYQGKGTGELALLSKLLHCFQNGDVAVADACYCSYFLIADLLSRGVDVLFRMHGSRHFDFRSGKRLGKKDHLVIWKKPVRPKWMDNETYLRMPNEICIRETYIEVKCKGFRTKSLTVASSFTDPKCTTAADLGDLYYQRWHVELDLRSIKQVLQMDVLRGKTPEMVHREIWVHLLAYNLVRALMAKTARKYRRTPRTLSFKVVVQLLITLQNTTVSEGTIMKIIAVYTVGDRPGRFEPRARKRRPGDYNLLKVPRAQARKALL